MHFLDRVGVGHAGQAFRGQFGEEGPVDDVLEIAGASVDLLAAGDNLDDDVFILCSDAFYKEMVAQEMVDQLANRSTATATHDLLDQALARGVRDNVSVVVVDCRD